MSEVSEAEGQARVSGLGRVLHLFMMMSGGAGVRYGHDSVHEHFLDRGAGRHSLQHGPFEQ